MRKAFYGNGKGMRKDKQGNRMTASPYRFISVTKEEKELVIYNPTEYPLIGQGAHAAVFKLSEDRCVKIYADAEQAAMEAEALKAGQHLSFFPRLYESGENYVVMEYIQAPTLKEYLKNSTYIPASIVKNMLGILKKLKKAEFTMLDFPLRHIFVLENEELKLIDYVYAFKREHPVPIKLLKDLNTIFLRDQFLLQVKRLEPEIYREWEKYFKQNRFDYRNLTAEPGSDGEAVKVNDADLHSLIGKGHQGAVFRVSEHQCIKIYGRPRHAEQESKVLLKGKKLPFIPKVYQTGDNFVLMEFLAGPDLNSFLKKQQQLSEDVTRQLLAILTLMKKSGFKLIDAPLRHTIITKDGFKLVDHVYSFVRDQERPLELFRNLHERGFLNTFLEQVKVMDKETYKEWTKNPIPVDKEGTVWIR
ncbi:hypothetical protein [Neobacillus mesonae]|uniref:hypothetical protein n=1 Tax=Neobacillus mesonae TaxID=1193713 RepID=UPI00203EE988|nr:hypothetical protein [Neobacillus mesonae]MCM3569527.1 hypothetical protein [Neobacillus mesonae]